MSRNDALALDANFENWRQKRFPTPPKDLNVFEYYCVDQFLRQFDLSDAQLKTGLIGKSGDGGVDALYMFVNGELVDADTELNPKTPNRVKIVAMQIKEGEGFSPTAVDKLYFFSDDLFDLLRMKVDYHQKYHDDLVKNPTLIRDDFFSTLLSPNCAGAFAEADPWRAWPLAAGAAALSLFRAVMLTSRHDG